MRQRLGDALMGLVLLAGAAEFGWYFFVHRDNFEDYVLGAMLVPIAAAGGATGLLFALRGRPSETSP